MHSSDESDTSIINEPSFEERTLNENSQDYIKNNNESISESSDESGEESSFDSDEESEAYTDGRPFIKSIKIQNNVTDISFNPNSENICVSDADGVISLYSYSAESHKAEHIRSKKYHKKGSIIRFSENGSHLFSASRASIPSFKVIDIVTGKSLYTMLKAHDCPIFSLLPIDNYLAATGDDSGNLKLWDYRRKMCTMEEKQCDEYISSLCMNQQKRIVLATSGEGTLTAFNVRKKKMEVQSELFDSEFLSLSFMKNYQKLVVGTGDGVLNIFNNNEWGNISDRYPVNSESFDSMVQITDDILCTGCSNGEILALSIQPNKILGALGKHGDLAVQSLTISHDHTFIASSSYDSHVKFYDVTCLESFKEITHKTKIKKKKKPLLTKAVNNFFSSLT